MNKSRAHTIINEFAGKRILVVGDVMLDEYIWGQVNRISPEAPVIVVDAERYSHVPGGAANVVNNLCALSATGMIVGAIGADAAGRSLAEALQAEGADTRGLVLLDDRPTTRKTRIIAHSQQVVRVDHERRAAIASGSTADLATKIAELASEADAIVLSDYQKGVVSETIVDACAEAAKRRGIPITGNLKPAAISGSAPIDIIQLNLLEAAVAMGGLTLRTEQEIEEAGRALLARTRAANLVITRGAHGLNLIAAGSASQHVPARSVEVYDTAGAGDTVISAMTLALTAGATPLEAVILASHCAGEAVKKLGVSTVTTAEALASFSE